MASVVIAGNTSGTVTLQAPDIAGSTTLTLPTTSGTLVTTAGGSTVPFALGSAAAPSITFTGDTNTGIFSPAADTIAFSEGGTEAMRLDSLGNLGLGVTPSPWTSVKALELGELGGAIAAGGNNTIITYNTYYSSGFKYAITGRAASYFQQDAGKHIWYTAPSGTAGNTITFTQAMTLDADGDLGIGQTSPAYKLDVSVSNPPRGGVARIRNTATSGQTGTQLVFLQEDIAFWSIGQPAGTSAFSVWSDRYAGNDGTERMRIDSSGNVGIGTSSPSSRLQLDGAGGAASSTASTTASRASLQLSSQSGLGTNTKLYAGVGSADYVWLQAQSSGDNTLKDIAINPVGGRLFLGTTSSIGGSSAPLHIIGSPCSRMQILTNGQPGIAFHNQSGTGVGQIVVNSSSTAYETSSDYRLKENIAPMTGALATVAALKPVTYNWKVDGSSGQGFIAHELAEVVPECVSGEKDAVDEEGNPVYQGIDTSFLVATLTAAIQEQQAIINEQASTIAAFEARLVALENK